MSDKALNPMKQHGAFSWNELMTSDVNGAKTFYAEMFNWKIEEIDSEMAYNMAKINGQDVAGIMPTHQKLLVCPPCGVDMSRLMMLMPVLNKP